MKPRVLIVDDEESIRIDLGKTLVRAGFEITPAEDCVTGWEHFEQQHFDLVILDLTMPDFQGSMSTHAGIDFLRRIKELKTEKSEIPVLVLTGTATLETAKSALNLGAFNFFEKSELHHFKGEILQELKEKAIKRIDRNLDLIIEKTGELRLLEDDIEIIQRLYSDCKQISISPLVPGYTTARVFLVNPVNLKGESLIPFVTKIGDRTQIENEYNNFKQHVEHKISSGRYPEVIKAAVSLSGKSEGMRVSFIGAAWKSMTDLKSFFSAHEIADIRTVIENLFEETLRFWHENKGRKEPVRIFEKYNYFADVARLRVALDRFFKPFKGQSVIQFEDFGEAFYDPINSLEIFNEEFKNLVINTHVCTIHGDLNVKNVLVDANRSCWLIDFQYTGPGHILTDYIELETSIKYGCVDASASDYWDLEKCLMSQKDFREELHFHHSNPDIEKAFNVVRKIREYAYLSVAPSRDMTEYYFGLLYYTLNLVRFPEKVISQEKKKSVLLAASLIYDRLKIPGMKIGFVGKNVKHNIIRQNYEDKSKFKILVADDDEGALKNLAKDLERTRIYTVALARNSLEVIQALESNEKDMFNLCILDLQMPNLQGQVSDTAGLDVLRVIKQRYPNVPVIILSAFKEYQTAVDSISRYGAANYYNKDHVARNKQSFLNDVQQVINQSLARILENTDQEKAFEGILKTLPHEIPKLGCAYISIFSKYYKKVGGDFYDFLPIDEDRIGFSIGDVSGKGLSAGVLMSKFCSFYRASFFNESSSIVSSMSKWNSFVYKQKTEADFITFFFGILDQKRHTIQFSNAGHPPPFIVSDGGTITDLGHGGVMLGVFPEYEYDESVISLNPGDVLALFTDGFTEAQDPNGEEFGIDRIKENVKANRHLEIEEIKDALMNAFGAFVRGGNENDDETLVILKMK